MVATDIKRRARHMVGPMLGCLLVTYFVYHSIQGDHGALAWRQLDLLIAVAETALESLDGQDEIKATTRESMVTVTAAFESTENSKNAVADGRASVDRAKADFPLDTIDPTVMALCHSPEPAIIITFSGEKETERE